ncbi:hypothetical protein R3P38DRAFT_2780633 [Favolaschia claudopus]|uniref:Uncharacterized protein n=1 Tax=Favolaschia claudopus TaxID=2862362 RepID=A0AAW0BAE9_9AGAR
MLNSHYPIDSAAASVEHWASILRRDGAPLIASGLAQPVCDIDIDKISIKVMDGGRHAKAMITKADGGRQEAVGTMVGVIRRKDLPPVRKHQLNAAKVPFARQHVSIVGLNTLSYQRALDNIYNICYAMHVGLPDAKVIQPTFDNLENLGVAIDLNCRYFTVGRDSSSAQKIAVDDQIDPDGVLHQFLNETVSHCIDNRVSYMRYTDDSSVEEKSPACFQVGDVVEVGYAFVGWRTGKRSEGLKYTCTLVLRSIALLEDKYSKEMFFKQSFPPKVPKHITTDIDSVPIFLKRSRSQDTMVDEEPTSQKMARLNLSDRPLIYL